MPESLQKASAEGTRGTGVWFRQGCGDRRLGSRLQAAMPGRRKEEQVAGPEGSDTGRLDAGRGIPIDSCLATRKPSIQCPTQWGCPHLSRGPGSSASKLLPSPGLLGATASF